MWQLISICSTTLGKKEFLLAALLAPLHCFRTFNQPPWSSFLSQRREPPLRVGRMLLARSMYVDCCNSACLTLSLIL
ncbi:hypothetical protein PILCRDRAFT_451450 [Piloderma croceum F 1598]|uniref:Uncharacterized protein n=1 Tax=Piloderma croceum (strain F 1598) TaxID=765440 RepID=A0A0C3BA46_PILCF|nr:hypothetical protein PILCRDRAFT_451450 [Piloderma croceum F 1598]